MHLLRVQILWMMFMTTLMVTNQTDKEKILIVFDEIIANIMTSKKFQAIIKELSLRCRKLNISLAFISKSHFSVLKDVTLNQHIILL